MVHQLLDRRAGDVIRVEYRMEVLGDDGMRCDYLMASLCLGGLVRFSINSRPVSESSTFWTQGCQYSSLLVPR
jgi:hypothetical protein